MNILKTVFFSICFLSGTLCPVFADDPYAFPVPFVQNNPDHTKIFFTNLPGEGTIKISTIAGDEVATVNIPPAQGMVSWNVKNTSGKPVASGVYFYEIDAVGVQKVGKLVVIR